MQSMDVETTGRLDKEAEILRTLQDSHLSITPAIYEFGVCKGKKMLVMELLGPTLQDVLVMCNAGVAPRARRFTMQTVCIIAYELIGALESLHK